MSVFSVKDFVGKAAFSVTAPIFISWDILQTHSFLDFLSGQPWISPSTRQVSHWESFGQNWINFGHYWYSSYLHCSFFGFHNSLQQASQLGYILTFLVNLLHVVNIWWSWLKDTVLHFQSSFGAVYWESSFKKHLLLSLAVCQLLYCWLKLLYFQVVLIYLSFLFL